jgi:outer membrane protein insertion porin family
LLTVEIGGPAPVLRGDVRVQRGAYTEPVSLAALARLNGGATLRPAADGSALDDLRLDVAITTVEDVRVDNNYGRFEGGAQVRLVGTAARPGMTGRITLREGGTIYAGGRLFTLSRGTVSFTDLTRIHPDLDVQAATRVGRLAGAGSASVTLTVTGTPDRFSFDLTSDTDASREEIATALIGGGVTGASAVTLLASDLLGATGRQLGLDTLRLDRGDIIRDEFREDTSVLSQDDENPVTRLTLSKRLRDNVEFTLSQSLAENGKTTFVVSYYPLANLELRAISRDDASLGLGVRHQVTFGGSRPARAAATRVEPVVASVRIEGTLAPYAEAELQRGLRLKAGDRFDYYRWQQDLDALAERYANAGYYEARVRGRRTEAGEGGLHVVYTVHRGPATHIRVDGLDLPADALAAIRDAWTRNVFDRFIVEDAETRVRGVLLARSFVAGVVSGRMESGDERKTLHLTVIPGPASDRRTIRFTGQAGVSQGQLEAVVAQAGLEVQGWIDRPALADALTAFYRAEGYLNARVTVDAPVLENGVGLLPVRIEEGPRAIVRAVQWTGVSAAQADAASRAAGLVVGAPYTLAAVDAARDRIERHFRTAGYGAVQVNLTATPVDDGARVDVTVLVTEGPRQVLQDVETVGATRTREGVVRRALGLRVGQPVNLEEWALARKRLFDTNVFRSVDIQAVPMGEPVDGVQPVRARVTVEEYPPWRLRYGVQADRARPDAGEDGRLEVDVGAIGEIRNQNLFGRALTGGVAARVERDFQRANTFLQTATFFGLPVRSSVFAYGSRETLREDGDLLAVTDLRGVSVEQRWRRRLGLETTYAYRFEFNRTYDPDPFPGDPSPLDERASIGRLTGALLWDRRDDPVSASRGTFSSISLERAAAWLGSDVRYGKVLAQQHVFWPLGPFVAATRVVGGRAYGDDLLFGDRFLAGGGTTVRGYAENGLGPRDIFGAARGGNQMLVFNQELRFPIYRWARGVGFLDAGNVFDDLSPFAWRELKVGYGAGLRIDSPIGLLRLDFGIPGSTVPGVRRRANQLGSGRWYFGIGHVF